MKTNVSIELNDEQRRTLASAIEGKPVKRLATRAEVRSFVSGALDAALNDAPVIPAAKSQPATSSAPSLSPQELMEVQRLRDEGRDDSYIRGWLQVGRRTS